MPNKGIVATKEYRRRVAEAVESHNRKRLINGPIPNAHLFFDLPQAERELRLAEIMTFAMEQAQSAIRFGLIATIKGIADRKGMAMDLSNL